MQVYNRCSQPHTTHTHTRCRRLLSAGLLFPSRAMGMELPSQAYRRLLHVCVGVFFCVGTHVVPFLLFQVAVWGKKPFYRLDLIDR